MQDTTQVGISCEVLDLELRRLYKKLSKPKRLRTSLKRVPKSENQLKLLNDTENTNVDTQVYNLLFAK
jgi:hypothetical protein